LKPTKIYVKPVLSLIAKEPIYSMAHITGGGFFDNIPGCFQGCGAKIHAVPGLSRGFSMDPGKGETHREGNVPDIQYGYRNGACDTGRSREKSDFSFVKV